METKLHTRIAGYKFSMQFHKEVNPPKSITYNGCTMEIKYDDDLLIDKCRTTAADDEVNRKTTLTKSREALATEFDTEVAKINQHFDDERYTLYDPDTGWD